MMMSPIYVRFDIFNFLSKGKDKISVDSFLSLKFLFNFLICLLLESNKLKLISLFLNLYFFGKALQIV